MPEYTDKADIYQVLREARTVAVLGAHPERQRPAHYVPQFLKEKGYRIIPVSPKYAGQQLFGETIHSALAEIHEGVDVVDVFRGSDKLFGHLDDVMAMQPRPRLVWLQEGIRNDEFAAELLQAGIDVIQDRCMLAMHKEGSLPPVG